MMKTVLAVVAILSLAIFLGALGSLTGSERISPTQITEIPEQYNDHLPLLLKDFQEGKISADEVIQILILFQYRGVYAPIDKIHPDGDFFFIDRERHAEIEEWEKQRSEQKQMK